MIVNPVLYGGGGKEPIIESLSSSQVLFSGNTVTFTASQNIETLLGFSAAFYYPFQSVVFSFPGNKSNSETFGIFCLHSGAGTTVQYTVFGNTIKLEDINPSIATYEFDFASISYIPL